MIDDMTVPWDSPDYGRDEGMMRHWIEPDPDLEELVEAARYLLECMPTEYMAANAQEVVRLLTALRPYEED